MGTTIKLYQSEEKSGNAEKTFVCFGVPRGGTSMVAGSLVGMGVFMGSNLPVNQEDPNFTNRSRSEMVKTIEDRNHQFTNWGWKFPNASYYLNDLVTALRNPHFIIVYRDPVAIAQRHIFDHNICDHEQAVESAFDDLLTKHQRNIDLARRHRVPTLLVSYEKAINDPLQFLNELAEFTSCELPRDLKPLLEFMRPNGYKKTPDPRVATEQSRIGFYIGRARKYLQRSKVNIVKLMTPGPD